MGYDTDNLEWFFRTLSRMHHNSIKAEMNKRGLKEASQPQILFLLKDQDEGMGVSQKEIADAVGISASTVATSVKRMEKSGLLQKIADQNDLRYNHVKLTIKGRQLLNECVCAFDAIDTGMFEGFSEDDRNQLKASFTHMIKNLEAMGAQPPASIKGVKKFDKKTQ